MSKTSKKRPIKIIFGVEPINKDKAAVASKVSTLLENGRKEIHTKTQLEKYPIGSLVSYFNKKGIFRSGGFIKKFGNDYFIYLTPEFDMSVRVRYKNIDKMFVGSVYETMNDVVSINPAPPKKSKYNVKIGDTIIYYEDNITLIKRFTHTKKYQRIKQWYDTFGNNES
ncbi:hypothetical protein HIRU_S975 [Hirudovirus strain Sangsue]|nr:hypothetical protein HIRU_S975 [Hirudovirus strain Sangsue]